MAKIEFHNASTGEWVDQFSRTPEDEDGIRIWTGIRGEGARVLMFHDSPGNDWNAQRLQHFNNRVRRACEHRVPRASLRDDDPDKHTEPTSPFMYWDGNDLVCKTFDIVFYYEEEAAKPGLSFTFRNVVASGS